MKRIRWAFLLLALPAAVAWLVYSVVHLVNSATAYHVRVIGRAAGAPMPSDAEVRRLLADQNHWGILAMFAVAAVALSLVLTLVTWLLGGSGPGSRR
jgi:hypothetical protein